MDDSKLLQESNINCKAAMSHYTSHLTNAV